MEIREYRKAVRCEHRGRLGRFHRCRQPLLGQCQYCGRGFCTRHGVRQDDGQEICVADRCETKRLDLESHLVFKDQARRRNAADRCALDSCGAAPEQDCERCRTRACSPHMRQVIMTIPRGAELSTEAVQMCIHCAQRLALWTDD